MISTSIPCDAKDKKSRPAYFHNPGAEPLRMITTGQLLDLAAEKWPSRNAIISVPEEKALTFLEVKEQAEQLGSSLLKLGLKSGDRLAIIGVNTVHWYITMLAAAKAGIILVMLNPACRCNDLTFLLKQARVKGIVTDHKFKTQNYPKLLAEIAPGIASAPHGQSLHCPELPDLSFLIVATDERLPGCYRLKDIMVLSDSKEAIYVAEEQIQPDDPVCIQFSSGTTGKPKPAVLSHFGTINNCHFFGKRLGYHKKLSSICLQVPLFHIFGSALGVLCALDYGISLIMPGPIFKKEYTIEVLQKYKCNIMYGTATMYVDICNDLKALLSESPQLREACANFDVVLSGGSICLSSVITDISTTFPSCKIFFAYGMTETSPVCFSTMFDDSFEKRTTTVGFVADHLEVKIVDRNGKIVNFGTPGEALFRSYANFLEYFGNEEKTKEIKTKAGWLKSGDIMILNENGYGTIVGRIKDIIIRGGENIFPTEIEEFLMQHPDILEAQVFGVPDDRMVEEVAVAIKLQKTSTMTKSSLQEYCKGKISHFKIPKYVTFVNEYPTTLSGKIKKYALKEMLEKELKNTKE